jgi:hypothetical protein
VIIKFKSHDEARAALWRDPTDPEHWREVAALWRLCAWLDPPRFPPGVQRFASIEEAGRARERAEIASHRRGP